ncbi:Adhesin Ata autotransporter [Pasteurella multocida]|uniref:YadA-like family protein n=1 Tax=Pasteurella multocida TaxID=747 RepID=UPI00102D52D7|nr:YadA-like family protein [Pasteurella multocida]TAA81878.1 Adhesin Ata autotransporter [Pasteurella multocida]HDR0678578.1 YadA-like family protein [Pasteurella multocida]HDR0689936.1 YadA-like family protein [Pasteurella multocida]HEA3312352.1 YadA-like family protein [Pasteurella multocida]HED4460824.1 YadA-like family protein [Pasteurella multocida]
MNKIYRTLWNVATQSWVVVSELAKAGGKTASGKSALVNSVSGFSFTLIAASVVLGSGQVSAAEVTGEEAGGDGNYCFYNAPSQSVVCGDATTKTTDKTDNKPAKSVVIGFGATNDGETNVAIGAKSQSSKAASIAIGDNAKALDNQTIAIGQNATANSDWDISIGRQAGADQTEVSAEGRNIAIGDGALKRGKGVNNNIALGTSAGERLAGTHNVIMGTYADADEAVQSAKAADKTLNPAEFNIQIDDKGKYYIAASNTVALGTRALATQLAAVAIGQQAKAFGNQSVAVGNGTKASGQTSIATGSNAHATGSSSIAIGGTVNGNDTARTLASDNFTIAMGLSAQATKSDAIAVGRNAKAAGSNTVSIGYNAGVTKTADEAQSDPNNKLEPATDAVFIGNKAGYKSNQNRMQVSLGKDSGEGVVGTENVTIGNSAGKNTKGNTNVAISSRAGQNVEGHDNFAALIEAGQNIKGSDNIAIGKHAGRSADSNAKLNISNTISLGRESVSLKNFGIAQGHKAKTDGVASIAIGYNAEAVGGETANIAIGENAKADASGAIVLGKNAEAKSLTVNNKKYGAYSAIVIGNEAKAIAKQAEAGKEQENPKDAIAIGSKAEAHYASTIALGFGAKSDTKAQAVSIGYNSNAKGYQAIAFGSEAKTTENAGSSIAFGTKAQTRASSSLAIGMQAETGFEGSTSALDGAYAVALGREAKAKRENTLAFGYKAVADHKDAVALGANSVTAEAVATNDATVNGFTYSGFAGKTPLATVSVGKASAERTITNVAAGRINATSTDAINGSQLYLALNALGNVGNTLVTNVLGGNAAINTTGDKAGTLTMSNIGGTGADTIDAAIAAVKTQAAQKTQVVAGDNITVTQGGTAENPTYTVATKKDVKFDSVIAGNDTDGGTKIDKDGLTFVNKDGNKVENSPSITKTGIDAGNQKVTNVQNGNIAKDSKDAVNGGQLFAQGEGVKNIIGGNTTYDPATGTYTNADIGGTGASTIHDAIAAINTSAKAAKTEVVQGENIVVTSAPGANGNTVYTVATAKEVTFDKTTVGSVVTDKNTNDITGLSNKTLGGDTFAKNGRAASEEQLNATQTNLATLLGGNAQNTNGNVTMTDIGGTGKNNINDAIKASRNEVKQGKNMVVTPTVGANGQTVYEVATADKVAFDEVKVGGITMDGTTNKISGIAKGDISENSTDAVNGSQLYELQQKIAKSGDNYNILNNRINKVDKDLRAGIAGANAAAGLPQAYIPGKSMVAVAAGTYKGQNAIALGMSRISDNGKVIIKLTGNTNSRGDFGASIGAGYQW